MPKKLVFALLLQVVSLPWALAQQQPLYTQYMFNMAAINPAYVGTQGVPMFTGLYREQWTSLPGAPSTQTLTADLPIKYSKASFGALLYHDELFTTEQFGFYGMYAYRIPLSFAKLALGLRAGAVYYQSDFSDLDVVFQNGNDISQDDPSFAANPSQILPNVGFGMFLHSKYWFVGMSIPELVNNTLEDQEITVQQDRHFYLHGGYIFDLNKNLKVRPGFLLQGVEAAPLSLDISANFLFNDFLWFGGSYRFGSSINLLLEVDIDQSWRIGYGYDFASQNDLGPLQDGSHEIMLSYRLRRNKNVIISPRYF